MANDVPTLKTTYYSAVHQAADKNKDGKVSLEELQAQKAELDAIQTFQYDPELEKRKKAVTVLTENFGVFANNRGLPPGSARTMEFRVGEDDHIRLNEINAIALRDGIASNITQKDVLGTSNDTNPWGIEDRPPLAQGLQRLIPFLLQLLSRAQGFVPGAPLPRLTYPDHAQLSPDLLQSILPDAASMEAARQERASEYLAQTRADYADDGRLNGSYTYKTTIHAAYGTTSSIQPATEADRRYAAQTRVALYQQDFQDDGQINGSIDPASPSPVPHPLRTPQQAVPRITLSTYQLQAQQDYQDDGRLNGSFAYQSATGQIDESWHGNSLRYKPATQAERLAAVQNLVAHYKQDWQDDGKINGSHIR